MSKGLALARIFYRAGHRVIGADFEPYRIPVCGHFSTSIEKFYRLPKPTSESGPAEYMNALRDIVEKENVELWVGCAEVAFVMEDAEAAEFLEKETNCKAVQFGVALTETLHEKHSFIDNTRRLGLNVPDTHLVTSETEALAVLYPDRPRYTMDHFYIMKSGGIDDSIKVNDTIKADMTILPQPTLRETEAYIKRLNPTPFRPFVLQQYISGLEYCTHSLIINAKVVAFVACPSTDLLTHYHVLSASSALFQAMLLYTSIYVRKMGNNVTGHFSIDFLVQEGIAIKAEQKDGISASEIRELMNVIYPIECNPSAHTAVVTFADEAEDMANAYLSLLPDHEPKGIANGHHVESLIVPRPNVPGYYWIGHDVVTLVILPLLGLLRFEITPVDMLSEWLEFVEHVIYWREGSYEIWDPWPAWWLYVGYWPCMFIVRLLERNWWSKCNASTTKIFGC